MTVEDFEEASAIYQIGQPPLRVDLLGELDAVVFQHAWERRVDALEADVPVHYICAEDLIANKLAAARLQDLADAEAIRSAKRAITSNKPGHSA